MYRVVIADDEVLIRMYIREILENNGYEVRKENRILLTGSLEKPAIIFRMPFFFMMQMEYVHLSIPRQKFCIRIRDLNCL